MRRRLEELDPLARYTAASERAAEQIIGAYSTSFGVATRLLGVRHRQHVRNIYALVRVADELVDGVADEAGIPMEQQRVALDQLEAETHRALRCGYSSNPVVHAFAGTARAAGFEPGLTVPFFAAMRTDLDSPPSPDGAAPRAESEILRFGDAAHADYVHGSAEVVGLMCLRVFLRDSDPAPEELRTLEHGARRLGAAFQNVNFLRDLGDDMNRLGRGYLGTGAGMDSETQLRWVGIIRAQLDDASAALPLLPPDARVAVGCALRLFSRLNERLARTPAAMLHRRRVRVPGPEKAWLVLRSTTELRRRRPA